MMKPILFNTEMVQAILEGRKTCTRRVIKFPEGQTGRLPENGDRSYIFYPSGIKYAPHKAGDILYVRETWQFIPCIDCKAYLMGICNSEPVIYEDKDSIGEGCFEFRADYPERERIVWRPSIHMPKEAARIFLRVKAVRVERLQEITPEQARAEGCDGRCNCPSSGAPGSLSCTERDFSIEKFESVWDTTIKPADLPLYGWDANPWVWVIEFERCEKPEEDDNDSES